MSISCANSLEGVGSGVAAALAAVDCVAADATSQTFGRLFAPGGALGTVLTSLLTLYVAFFAIGLLLGRSSLSVRSLTPRMITLGMVLTFATSWVAYQSVVWNLAVGSPDWLASVLTGSEGSATMVFAGKLDVVFMAIQSTTQGTEDFAAFSPQGMLWMGATLLMLGTVGVLVTARIGLALLVALGPIFVVMALFDGTRGLFTGWLKGVVMLALTPLFAVLAGTIMLELAVPVLSALTQNPTRVDPQAAMAFFVIGAVHVALMVMVVKVASTMVAGWQVFGLARPQDNGTSGSSASLRSPSPPVALAYAYGGGAGASQRRIEVATVSSATPANNMAGGTHSVRQTNVFATSSGDGSTRPLNPATSRTRGIGNRFRSARPVQSEKMK